MKTTALNRPALRKPLEFRVDQFPEGSLLLDVVHAGILIVAFITECESQHIAAYLVGKPVHQFVQPHVGAPDHAVDFLLFPGQFALGELAVISRSPLQGRLRWVVGDPSQLWHQQISA